MTLRPRLALACTGITLGALLIFGLAVRGQARLAAMDTAAVDLQTEAIAREAAISQQLQRWQTLAGPVAQDYLLVELAQRFLQSHSDSQRLQPVLTRMLTGSAAAGLQLLDAQGVPMVSVGDLYGLLPQPGEVDSGVKVDIGYGQSGQAVPWVSVPIVADQRMLGYLKMVFSPGDLRLVIADRSGLGAKGQVFLVRSDTKGTAVLDATQGDAVTVDRILDLVRYLAALGVSSSHGEARASADASPEEVPNRFVYGANAVRNTNLMVIAVMPSTQALEPVLRIQRNLLMSGILVALLAGLVGWWVAGTFYAPIVGLARVAADIQQGNYERRATMATDDELGALAMTFNAMTSRLVEANRTLEQRVAERTEALDKSNRELRRRAEELARSNAELDQFASLAAHDLRAPLRAISGFARLLSKPSGGVVDDDSARYLSRISTAASRMQVMINDLHELSQVGPKTGLMRPLDLNPLMDDLLQDLAQETKRLNANIVVENLPVVVASESLIRQLFANLFSNALKYSKPDQAPEIDVSVEIKPDKTVISFRDNGIGFDPQFAQRIFGAFQRLHGRDEYPGSGLGLAICEKIAAVHNGTIWAESEPGRGATFKVELGPSLAAIGTSEGIDAATSSAANGTPGKYQKAG